MRRRLLTAAMFAIATTAAPLLAHEGHAHKYMGKVVSISEQQIEVETKEGTKVAAPLAPDTKYLRGKGPATRADVKIGERVVIAVVEENKVKKVTEVLLGEAAATTPKPHAH